MKTLHNGQDLGDILSRIAMLNSTSPRRWGKMSSHQMVCHLSDAFKLYMGQIIANPPSFPYPSKLLKWGCLWVPFTWPRGFKTIPEVDQQKAGTRPVEFEHAMTELRSLVTQFARVSQDFVWPTHPYLGRMSHKEWMRLGYLHTDHHLRQFGV